VIIILSLLQDRKTVFFIITLPLGKTQRIYSELSDINHLFTNEVAVCSVSFHGTASRCKRKRTAFISWTIILLWFMRDTQYYSVFPSLLRFKTVREEPKTNSHFPIILSSVGKSTAWKFFSLIPHFNWYTINCAY
jgi:hypothetical protein